jgi:sugar phosphate isomerase/epimerase
MIDTRCRLGLSGHAFADFAPERLLETMTARFGIRSLDYWPFNRGTLELPAYGELLERFGVSVYVVNAPSTSGRLMAPGQTRQAQESLLAAIEEAQALGAPYVQMYTGVPEWPEYLTVVKTFARDLAPVLDRAAQAGVTLLLENNLDQRGEDTRGLNPSRSPEMVLAVLEEVDSPYFKVSYDPCNFYAIGAEGFPYAYDLLKPYIANVHLKDCVRYSPLLHAEAGQKLLTDVTGGPHLPVPVGQGAINWSGILRRLEADRYGGRLTLDPFSVPELLCEWCEQSLHFLARCEGIEPVH